MRLPLTLLTLAVIAAAQTPETIALTHANIIYGTGAPTLRDQPSSFRPPPAVLHRSGEETLLAEYPGNYRLQQREGIYKACGGPPARHNWLKSEPCAPEGSLMLADEVWMGSRCSSAENLRAGNSWKWFMRLPEILARWIQRV